MKKSLIGLFLTALAIIGLASCSKDNSVNQFVPKHTYVIVPGAWSAPYAWQTVKAQLEASGQKVKVVQLPGHGTDQTPFSSLTLDKYRDYVISVIDSTNTKVILVGHSLAGMVISEVAEKVPSKIEKMIYVGAYLPQSGQSLLDLANTDSTSLLGKSLLPSQKYDTLDLIHDKIIDIFIQDGSADVKSLVLKYYKVEPGFPFFNKATLSAANFGSVDKYYIHTLQDHAIPPALQNRMVASSGIKKIFQINTSHSPFLAKPDSLVILLKNIVDK